MHFSLLLISNGQSPDEMLDPFWEENEVEQDEDGYWYNPDAKWDWYQIGGRWYGHLEATDGRHGEKSWFGPDDPDENGHYDIALVSDLTKVPSDVYSVLDPFGEWHDCETFREDLANDEHPLGQFVKDEHWSDEFEERFIKPYQNCTAYLIDYHI